MAQMTITVAQVSDEAREESNRMVAAYAETNGSNRTNWGRVEAVLAAVLTVLATGASVEVTDDFIGGTSPMYNIVHRCLSMGLIRPHWHQVKVLVLFNTTQKGAKVTGTKSSTIREGRAFIVPV